MIGIEIIMIAMIIVFIIGIYIIDRIIERWNDHNQNR
jgi:uncharacterized protein YneF (UPF0154 family)